jgi:hypothetical protein
MHREDRATAPPVTNAIDKRQLVRPVRSGADSNVHDQGQTLSLTHRATTRCADPGAEATAVTYCVVSLPLKDSKYPSQAMLLVIGMPPSLTPAQSPTPSEQRHIVADCRS